MMSTSTPVGLALTSIAGMMSGNCMLPTKFVRTWKWENVWEIFSVVSLILLPWALALVLVRDLEEVDRMLTLAQIAAPLALGAGWGITQILFGISVKRLGLRDPSRASPLARQTASPRAARLAISGGQGVESVRPSLRGSLQESR